MHPAHLSDFCYFSLLNSSSLAHLLFFEGRTLVSLTVGLKMFTIDKEFSYWTKIKPWVNLTRTGSKYWLSDRAQIKLESPDQSRCERSHIL